MPADRLEWFPFSPADFLLRKGVACLDAREMGVYVRLMCHAWMHGPLPKPMRSLAVLSGLSAAEMAECWPALEPCFTEAEDGWVLEWLEEVRQQQAGRREAARLSGQEGARRRWGAHSDPSRVPNGDPNGETMPIVEVRDKRTTTTTPPTPPEGGKRAGEKKPKREPSVAHPLPADWQPPGDSTAVAAAAGVDHDRALVEFRDHAASKGWKYVDWNATFRNFLRSPYRKRVNQTQLHGRGNGTSVHSPEPEPDLFIMPPKEPA